MENIETNDPQRAGLDAPLPAAAPGPELFPILAEDAVPVDTVPVDAVPVDTVPVDAVPVDTVPVAAVPPRIWSAILVAVLAMTSALLGGGVIVGLVQRILDFASTPVGLIVVLLPSQMTFLAWTLGAAFLSPRPWKLRLALVGSRRSWVYWPVFAAATPLVGWVTMFFLGRLVNVEGSQLDLVNTVITQAGPSFGLVMILVALIPGFVEELLFRGYVQTRLLERLHPLVAIAITTILFSLAHLDPVHSPAVIPLGIWLGIIGWRCASAWPAILCHIFNNAFAVCAARVSESRELTEAYAGWEMHLAVAGAVAFVLSVILLVRSPGPHPSVRPAAVADSRAQPFMRDEDPYSPPESM